MEIFGAFQEPFKAVYELFVHKQYIFVNYYSTEWDVKPYYTIPQLRGRVL